MMPGAAVRTKTGPPGREHAGRPGAAAVGTRSGRSPRRGDAAMGQAFRCWWFWPGPPPWTSHGRTGTDMAEPRYGSGARNTPGRTTAAKNGGASNGRASKGRAAAKPAARPAAKQPAKPPARPAAKQPAKPLAARSEEYTSELQSLR